MDMGYDYAEREDARGRLDPHFSIAARPDSVPRQPMPTAASA